MANNDAESHQPVRFLYRAWASAVCLSVLLSCITPIWVAIFQQVVGKKLTEKLTREQLGRAHYKPNLKTYWHALISNKKVAWTLGFYKTYFYSTLTFFFALDEKLSRGIDCKAVRKFIASWPNGRRCWDHCRRPALTTCQQVVDKLPSVKSSKLWNGMTCSSMPKFLFCQHEKTGADKTN